MGFVAVMSICKIIAEDATNILDSVDAMSMQKQRLQIRQRLLTLNTQIKKTEAVVMDFLQNLKNAELQNVPTQLCLSQSFTKLLST